MKSFINNRHAGNVDVAQPGGQNSGFHIDVPPSRPRTAQDTSGAPKHLDQGHAYDTDAESFDMTRSSIKDEQRVVSRGMPDQQGYDTEDYEEESGEDDGVEQHGRQDHHFNHDEHGQHYLASMYTRMRMQQQIAAQETPDSYPPTTSGEPETMDESEARYEQDPSVKGQRRSHVAQMLYPREPQASAPALGGHLTKENDMASPVVAIRHRLVGIQPQPQSWPHPQPQNMANVAPQPLPQPTIGQTNLVRHPQVNQSGSTRKPNPQEFHFQKSTPPAFAEQGQGHVTTYDQEQHPRRGDLDYEIEELYHKDFASLQNDPFDGPRQVNNNSNGSALPSNAAPPSLEQKLSAFANQDPEQQKNFFSSLSIDEWEEAGDWFQTRFSEILGHLREARKQKRTVAREFEQEIAQRQQKLVKKRKVTEDALTEMKESGSLVLMNTPKKKQKHRK